MQYILTKEEFEALGPKVDIAKWKAHAQILATMVADNIPRKHEDGTEAWKGCYITIKVGYCDLCPVEDLCPYPYKAYSK